MLKIAIIGASGRMGKEIISLICEDSKIKLEAALEHETSDSLGVDAGTNAGVRPLGITISAFNDCDFSKSDVVIDFSSPTSILDRIHSAVSANCGVVIGTTGLSNQEKRSIQEFSKEGARIVFAPNMSVGVNLLFVLAQEASKVLGNDFDVEIIEMHHKHKKDSPSGTAEKLGQIIASAKGLDYQENTSHGRFGMVGERKQNEIGMHSLRGGDVVGDHTVVFASEGERIELTHKASSRSTFARGALRAASFLTTAKPGFYDMLDVLGLHNKLVAN